MHRKSIKRRMDTHNHYHNNYHSGELTDLAEVDENSGYRTSLRFGARTQHAAHAGDFIKSPGVYKTLPQKKTIYGERYPPHSFLGYSGRWTYSHISFFQRHKHKNYGTATAHTSSVFTPPIMSSQEGCATESTTISGISSEENERITESLDVELSSRRQMSSSRPIRFYTGLFAIVMVVVGLSCFTNNNDNVHGMTSESDSRVSSILKPRARDRNSSQTLPKVQQPTKLLSKEEHPDHNSLIRKLRSEFHEWTVEHGRDYGSRDEKEKRFQIWKDNHLRCVVFVLIVRNNELILCTSRANSVPLSIQPMST